MKRLYAGVMYFESGYRELMLLNNTEYDANNFRAMARKNGAAYVVFWYLKPGVFSS